MSGCVRWLVLVVCSRCCWLRRIVSHTFKVLPKVEPVKVKNDSSGAGVGSGESDDWCFEHGSDVKHVRARCDGCGKKFWHLRYCPDDEKRGECERCYDREHVGVKIGVLS